MLRPNRTAINHLNVTLRKTRRHCMPDMVAVVAKQQYRADHLWRLRLDHQHKVREDFVKRRVIGNHPHDAFLLRAKLSVILVSKRNDVRPHGRHFLSLRSSKVGLLLIGHLSLSFRWRLFYAWYVRKAILRRRVSPSDRWPLTAAVEDVQNAPNSHDNQPKESRGSRSCLPYQDLFREKSPSSSDCPLITNPITYTA